MAEVMRQRIVPVSLVRVAGPAAELVSLEQARLHCRVPELSDPDEDARAVGLLGQYITAAREYLEAATGRTFYLTTWRVVIPAAGRVALPRATPLRSVASIEWRLDAWSLWQPLTEGADYAVDASAMPGAIECARSQGELRVEYDAGADAGAEAESAAIQAALLMIGALWENREAETVTDRAAVDAAAFRHGLDALIGMLRVAS
jgi:uncharacterized phiE125 gp8 family phage protein